MAATVAVNIIPKAVAGSRRQVSGTVRVVANRVETTGMRRIQAEQNNGRNPTP